MIITRLNGGLGNQMFQYAAGRALAVRHGTTLKLDISNFGGNPERNYRLAAFDIKASIADKGEIEALRRDNVVQRLFRRMPLLATTIRISHVRERFFQYDSGFSTLPDNVYLDGYWQSERYFHDIEDIIRADFTFVAEPDPVNREIAGRIANTDSVAVHVRRGDYVSNAVARDYHGVLALEYYNRAVSWICGQVAEPHFYVFSDDPAWARDNLRVDHPVEYIDHNPPNRDYEDLRLMALCRNQVVANSSFSWWGAWLNHNPKKKIVAPARWFNQPDIDTSDLCPREWYRL